MARLINHMLFARKQLICGWHAVSCEWNVSHWDACEHSRRRVNSFTVHIRKKVNSKLDDMLQVLLNVPARSHGFRSAPPFTSLRVCSVCYVRSARMWVGVWRKVFTAGSIFSVYGSHDSSHFVLSHRIVITELRRLLARDYRYSKESSQSIGVNLLLL